MKERLTRNIGMKIISLIIAVFLWIFINGLIDPVTTEVVKNIPVSLMNEDAMSSVGKIFEVISGEQISVKVRAKRSVAESLDIDDFSAIADVTKMTEMHAVAIVVNCPKYSDSEVEILDKWTEDGTDMMMLALDDSDTQSFAVSVVPDGVVADGYFITESQVSPNLLTITGSKTQIARIAKIAVLVNVNGAAGSFVQSATPIVYDEEGNIVSSSKISLSSEQVQVSMTLLPTKRVDINVVATGTPFYNFDCTGIEFAPNTVLIAGTESDLTRISKLKLSCDISHARGDVEAVLSLEEALKETYGNQYLLVDESDKVSVKATVERMETKEILISSGAIELKNLNPGLIPEFAEATKTLRAVAVPAVLDTISASNVKPYIDCAEYKSPGSYFAVIRTQVPNNVVRISTIEIMLHEKPTEPDDEVSQE